MVVVNRDLDFGWGSIHQAGGMRNDANNSGLVLTLTLQSGKQALLVGDGPLWILEAAGSIQSRFPGRNPPRGGCSRGVSHGLLLKEHPASSLLERGMSTVIPKDGSHQGT